MSELQETQNNCNHQNARDWAIGLQHNFPDDLPRGICLRCFLVIHPKHWESGGPNQTIVVNAHKLYPVVKLMEKRDFDLAALEQEYIQHVDDLLGSNQANLIGSAELAYNLARAMIMDTFNAVTEPWRSVANDKNTTVLLGFGVKS